MRVVTTYLAMTCLIGIASADETYTGIFWNIHSGHSDADTIARNMAEKGDVDFWGLSEVPDSPQFLQKLEDAIEQKTGKDYVAKVSDAGGSDRLAILFNSERLTAVPYTGNVPSGEFKDLGNHFFELPGINTSGTVRPSLGVQLQAGNDEVIVLVNHWKASGDPRSRGIRMDQATETCRFIRLTPGIPIIVGGDHNIPIKNGGSGTQQQAFRIITSKTQYLKPTNRGRVGSYKGGSVLDSVFVANDDPGYESKTTILNRVGNRVATTRRFRDNKKTADHRPLRIVVRSNDMDSRIDALQDQIALLKADLKLKEEELARLLNL